MTELSDQLHPPLVSDEELLNPFEIKMIPADYREYYKTRKQNFLAIIERFPGLWNFYQALDSIVLNEFTDLQSIQDINKMFPLMLLMNSHAKIRLSIELAFSGCLPESRSLMRDAVEFVAHANSMFKDAALQAVWLNKDEELEAFRDAFERNKKNGLFKDQPELHRVWGQLSEMGSHATISALCERFVISETKEHLTYRLNYCGADERVWIPSLFSLLLNFSSIEKIIYENFKGRLQFDEGLFQRRQRCDLLKETLRKQLITRYSIQPPTRTPSP